MRRASADNKNLGCFRSSLLLLSRIISSNILFCCLETKPSQSVYLISQNKNFKIVSQKRPIFYLYISDTEEEKKQ